MAGKAFSGLSEAAFDQQVAQLRRSGRVSPRAKQPRVRKRDCTPRQWAAHLEYERLAYAKRKGVKLRVRKVVRVPTKNGIKVFADLKAAAKHFGVNYFTAHWRKTRLGWSYAQALQQAPPPGRTKTATHYRKKAVRVVIDGHAHVFESQAAAFRALGQDEVNGQAQLDRGWTIRQALGLDPPPVRKGRVHGTKTVVKVRGKAREFPSFKAACRFYRVDPDRAYQQRARGWSIEQSLGLESPPRYDETAGGYIYVVTHVASRRQYVGLTRLSIEERWKQHCEQAADACGGSLSRPLMVAINNYGSDAFTIEQLDTAGSLGKLNAKERHWIEKLGTMWPNGFNAQKGGSGPGKGKLYEWKGRVFRSSKEIARHFGINASTFLARLRAGATLEEALEMTERFHSRNLPTTVDGVTFPSRLAAAKHFGVNYGTFMERLRDSWPIDEALDIVKQLPRKRRFAKGKFVNRLSNAYELSESGCWIWKERVCGTTGLPVVTHEGRRWMASRLVYTLLRSPISKHELCIRKCENKLCVNPDHMVIGGHAELHRIAGQHGKRKGENAYQARINTEQVMLIRSFLQRYKDFSGRPGPKNFIARWFGLTVSSVRDIAERRTWSHVP